MTSQLYKAGSGAKFTGVIEVVGDRWYWHQHWPKRNTRAHLMADLTGDHIGTGWWIPYYGEDVAVDVGL